LIQIISKVFRNIISSKI